MCVCVCVCSAPQLLPWLERFDTLYLWLDDDKAGRDGCDKLEGKLGRGRCRIVRPLPEMYRDGVAPKVGQNDVAFAGLVPAIQR